MLCNIKDHNLWHFSCFAVLERQNLILKNCLSILMLIFNEGSKYLFYIQFKSHI